MQYFEIFLTALFISSVMLALLIKIAGVLRIVDFPEPRKIHLIVTPRVAGQSHQAKA